jgi:hypothetical protein
MAGGSFVPSLNGGIGQASHLYGVSHLGRLASPVHYLPVFLPWVSVSYGGCVLCAVLLCHQPRSVRVRRVGRAEDFRGACEKRPWVANRHLILGCNLFMGRRFYSYSYVHESFCSASLQMFINSFSLSFEFDKVSYIVH